MHEKLRKRHQPFNGLFIRWHNREYLGCHNLLFNLLRTCLDAFLDVSVANDTTIPYFMLVYGDDKA